MLYIIHLVWCLHHTSSVTRMASPNSSPMANQEANNPVYGPHLMGLKELKRRTLGYQNGAIASTVNRLPSVYISVTQVGSLVVNGHAGISRFVMNAFRALGDNVSSTLNLEAFETTSSLILPRKADCSVDDVNQADLRVLLCELVKLTQDETGLGKHVFTISFQSTCASFPVGSYVSLSVYLSITGPKSILHFN